MEFSPLTISAVTKLTNQTAIDLQKALPPGFGVVVVTFQDQDNGWTTAASQTRKGRAKLADQLQVVVDQIRSQAAGQIDGVSGVMQDQPKIIRPG